VQAASPNFGSGAVLPSVMCHPEEAEPFAKRTAADEGSVLSGSQEHGLADNGVWLP